LHRWEIGRKKSQDTQIEIESLGANSVPELMIAHQRFSFEPFVLFRGQFFF
jgi:hypothetical protein